MFQPRSAQSCLLRRAPLRMAAEQSVVISAATVAVGLCFYRRCTSLSQRNDDDDPEASGISEADCSSSELVRCSTSVGSALDSLPDDLLLMVWREAGCGPVALGRYSQVARRWRQLAAHDSLWTPLLSTWFGASQCSAEMVVAVHTCVLTARYVRLSRSCPSNHAMRRA
eukprot:SAG31_NODE_204_length_20414_cov_19.143392_14_plen_169_part_00